MHIPDGYLSPQTCAVMTAAMLPVWAVSAKKTKKILNTRQIPLMAIGSAFSFTIMMYNIPIPDGTTAHAVGGALLAVVLGPWAACISISVALGIQALLFGDGGILSYGANAFNIAFVLPFTAYYTYKLIAGNSGIGSKRRWIGGFLGGYVGINLAALSAAVQFGLQPLLHTAADGTALYCPYPVSIAVPAMALAHLIVAGPVEGVVTGLVIRYFQINNRELLVEEKDFPVIATMTGIKRILLGLCAMVLFTPLGLLAGGTAWGEWAVEEVKAKLGFVPYGMAKISGFWRAPLPDYTLPGLDNNFFGSLTVYIFSAVIFLAIMAATFLFSRNIKENNAPK